jgi:hypothetical protein
MLAGYGASPTPQAQRVASSNILVLRQRVKRKFSDFEEDIRTKAQNNFKVALDDGLSQM